MYCPRMRFRPTTPVIRLGLDEEDALEAYEVASEMISIMHQSGGYLSVVIDAGDDDMLVPRDD